jgi:hypothetical protein
VSVPSSELAPPPRPLSPFPPENQGGGMGGGNTRLQVWGWGEPIQTTGEKAWHSGYSVVYSIQFQKRLKLCLTIKHIIAIKIFPAAFVNSISNHKATKSFFEIFFSNLKSLNCYSSYLQKTLRMMPRLAPASRPVGPFRLSTHPTQVAQDIVYVRKRPIMSFYLAPIPLLTSTCTGRLYLLRKEKKD